MVPGELSTVMPWRMARPERGRTWPSLPGGNAMAMPVGIMARAPGAISTRRIGRHRGEQIEPGRERALVLRQRQIGAVRQPHDAHLDGFVAAHCFASFSAAAMRATRLRATSSFDCGGQDSTPAAVTR